MDDILEGDYLRVPQLGLLFSTISAQRNINLYVTANTVLPKLKRLNTFATSASTILHHNTLTHINPNGYLTQGKTTQAHVGNVT